MYGRVVGAALEKGRNGRGEIDIPLNDPCLAACCVRDLERSRASHKLKETLQGLDRVRSAVAARQAAGDSFYLSSTASTAGDSGAMNLDAFTRCCAGSDSKEISKEKSSGVEDDDDSFFDDDDDDITARFYEARRAELAGIAPDASSSLPSSKATQDHGDDVYDAKAAAAERDAAHLSWCSKEGCSRAFPHEHITRVRKNVSGYV